MGLKLYNVLSGKKEEFIPLEEGKVKMYACGITASGEAHIGHAYQAIVFDVIKKYLEYKGYDVTYVRNYTDVDDKIILRARALNVNPTDYANKMMKKIDGELSQLYIDKPTIQSKATECITDMIDFIQRLIDTGHAYSTEEGNVFFDVSSFSEYGKLSHRNIDESLAGVRKDVEPGKRDFRDFALWKTAGNDEIWWESPWGKGRPGWHIECSTMSMKYLGESIDIHGGGKDLIFPHHENEIAQSESLTGKQFSKYWMHNGLVKVNGEKMSKSLGNGIILEDLLKEYNPEVVRLTLLGTNYRSDINIMDGMFDSNEARIYTIYKAFDLIDRLGAGYMPNKESEIYKTINEEFINAMDNDFNTSLAITNINKQVTEINKLLDKTTPENIQKLVDIKYALINIYKVLGLLQQDPKQAVNQIKNKYLNVYAITEAEINELIVARSKFKQEKNYQEADRIRNELTSKGINIKDTKEGTNWEIEIPCKRLIK